MTIIIHEDDVMAETIPLVSAAVSSSSPEDDELDGSRGKRIQHDGTVSDVHDAVTLTAVTTTTDDETTAAQTSAAAAAAGIESTTTTTAPATADTTDTSATAATRGIKFDKVIIREYARTVGDNPSCSSGPPVSIGWEYNILGEFDFEYYESVKPPSRCQQEMILPRKIRFDLLQREWNIRNQDVAFAVRQNVRIKNQRKTTVNNLDKAEKLELVYEICSRRITQFIKLQKPMKKQVDILLKQHEMAQYYKNKQLLLVEEQQAESGGYKKKSNLLVKGKNTSSERSNSSDVTHTMTEWNDISLRSATNYTTTTTTTAAKGAADNNTNPSVVNSKTTLTTTAASSSSISIINNNNNKEQSSSVVNDDTTTVENIMTPAATKRERRLSSSSSSSSTTGKQQKRSSSSRTFLKARKASDRQHHQQQQRVAPIPVLSC